MSKVVYNPTNEDFEVLFQGIPIRIKGVGFDKEKAIEVDGQKIKMDDARANHCLHELGPRGLCQLEYGDEAKIDHIREAAVRRNKEFKAKQVQRYNQQNEMNRQTNRPFIAPPAHIREYADELGIKLIKPFEIEDPSKDRNVKLEAENAELKKMLDRQSRQFDLLMKKMEKMGGTADGTDGIDPKQPLPDDKLTIEHCVSEFKMLDRQRFVSWVKENRERIETWPVDAQDQVRQKWDKFYDEDFPF